MVAATGAIGVFIADDHSLLRRAIAIALAGMEGIRVVGEAGDGRAAVEGVERRPADVVLMDIVMPLLDGVEAMRRIRRSRPRCKALVLTGAVQADGVVEILRAGAAGMIGKTASLEDLERAIRAVHRGEIYVSPDLAGPALAAVAARGSADDVADDLAGLSSREREVVQLIGEGQGTQEIAAGLVLSPKTVAQHKANIVRKLGLKSARELQLLTTTRAVARQLA